MREDTLIRQQRERAAKMCRIQINVARQAGKKIDYLKQQKEDR